MTDISYFIGTSVCSTSYSSVLIGMATAAEMVALRAMFKMRKSSKRKSIAKNTVTEDKGNTSMISNDGDNLKDVGNTQKTTGGKTIINIGGTVIDITNHNYYNEKPESTEVCK